MIKISKLNKIYNEGKTNAFHALKNINLYVESGEMVAIIGKSGAGKSSLMHIIGTLDKSNNGNYFFENTNINKISESKISALRCNKIGFVLQDFGLLVDETVLHNVCVPLYFSNTKLHKIKETAINTIELVGIKDIMHKKIKYLSGGQKQRVAIARALVNNPLLILADEPTGALDSKTSEDIMSLFKKLNNKGITIIIVTHEMNIAKYCDRIVTMSDGEIIADVVI